MALPRVARRCVVGNKISPDQPRSQIREVWVVVARICTGSWDGVIDGEILRSCPMSEYMDHYPRALNAMLLAGRSGDVLRSRAIWACTSCYACTVERPKQLPVTDTIYALRRASTRAGVYPRRFPTPIWCAASSTSSTSGDEAASSGSRCR